MSAPSKKIVEFPALSSKLQAPSKKSLFERQKADAEAKRRREEAETKAVYEDFVKSFDNDDDDGADDVFGKGAEPPGRFTGGSQPRRHFGGGREGGVPMGPSSMRDGMGHAGRGGFGGGGGRDMDPPPPSFGKKRAFEGFQTGPSAPKRDEGRLSAFDDYDDAPTLKSGTFKALMTDDDDMAKHGPSAEERAVPKPTLRLASLPPGTSPAFIKALIPSTLVVDMVKILPPPATPVYTERRSMSAIVTLAKDTAANDIDSAVSGLQNKYLGYGYHLELHRHLSSAAISSSTNPSTNLSSSATSQPFGAKPVVLPGSERGHGPNPHQRGFAPPTSYGPPGPQLTRNGPLLYVPVEPPSEIRELKLIHKTVENLLTHGAEFEALLMSRPEVQREEKWAWLWDARSTGGIWYRWRLWETLTGSQSKQGQTGKYLPLFEDSSAWKAPEKPLAFEYVTRLDEFVSDKEYNSSDEDDSGDEGARRQNHGGGMPDPSTLKDDGTTYLNPLEKAKLTHLLARLPTSTGRLRKGDVARVTAFAISHAGRGADEVVSAIISNIERPYASSSANPEHKKEKDQNQNAKDAGAANTKEGDEEVSDTSSASLIGIFIISDILSSSSTSGVRHAWRYRQLFETALKQRRVFERLGRMERKLNWGRLRAEKWKRSVNNILSLWEGWCVFPQESQDSFVHLFNNPPQSAKEHQAATTKESLLTAEKSRSKWKAVEVAPRDPRLDHSAPSPPPDPYDPAPAPDPMDSDENVDGVPMDDSSTSDDEGDHDHHLNVDGDGDPMQQDDPDTQPPDPDTAITNPPPHEAEREAVDMFADSD